MASRCAVFSTMWQNVSEKTDNVSWLRYSRLARCPPFSIFDVGYRGIWVAVKADRFNLNEEFVLAEQEGWSTSFDWLGEICCVTPILGAFQE